MGCELSARASQPCPARRVLALWLVPEVPTPFGMPASGHCSAWLPHEQHTWARVSSSNRRVPWQAPRFARSLPQDAHVWVARYARDGCGSIPTAFCAGRHSCRAYPLRRQVYLLRSPVLGPPARSAPSLCCLATGCTRPESHYPRALHTAPHTPARPSDALLFGSHFRGVATVQHASRNVVFVRTGYYYPFRLHVTGCLARQPCPSAAPSSHHCGWRQLVKCPAETEV